MNELTAQGGRSQPEISSLLSRAKRDPAHTLTESDLLLSQTGEAAVTGTDRAIATWIRGVALYEMGRNREAIDALSEVVRSEDGLIGDRAAVSLASAEAAAGRGPDAIERLTELMAKPNPIVRALAGSQLGLLHLHRGELKKSLPLLEHALPALRAQSDEEPAVARILINIGTCHLLLGDMRAAQNPLREAIEIAERTGQTLVLAGGLQNLGYAESRLGNTDGAIEQMEHARRLYGDMGDATRRNLATLFEDLSETYRFAGMTRRALRYARLAAWAVRDGDNLEKQTDADYQRALCLLDNGDLGAALVCAERTRMSYLACDRPLQARRADVLILEATPLGTPMSAVSIASGKQAAAELEDAGWTAEAMAMKIRLAELLAADHQPGPALACVEDISEPSPDAPLLEWLDRTFACALALTLRDQSPGSHVDQARSRLRRARAEVVDPELRLSAARRSDRFRALALGHAVAANDAGLALAGEEQWRTLAGVWLRARSSARQSTPVESESDPLSALTDFVGRHLGPTRVLLQWAVTGDDLYRIETSAAASTLSRCGRYHDVRQMADKIRHSMARLLRPGLSAAGSAAMARTVADDCTALGNTLGVPTDGRELVLAPQGALVELPWRLIAAGAEIQLMANLTDLGQLARPLEARSASLLVGPDLEHTDVDVRAFTSAFPEATVITEDEATVAALGELMQHSSFVHVAAHGHFRSDSPRHSSIELADGPAQLHQLQSLTHVPAIVVLGVCDAGRGETLTGGERRGAATALLDAGTECVVAPICAVPDLELAQVLARFYQALPGRTAHDALAMVAGTSIGNNPRFWATAHATQCVGAQVVVPMADAR